MNAKISVLVICVEAIIYLLLHSLHDCTFKFKNQLVRLKNKCSSFLELISGVPQDSAPYYLTFF